MSLLGTKRSRTTAYHPQTKGMVERFHRQLKAALKAQPNPDAWIETLPLILLGIRTALKEDLNTTTAEMVCGTTLRLPGEFFSSSSATRQNSSTSSRLILELYNRLHHVQPTGFFTSPMTSPLLPMFLSVKMLSASLSNHLTMDHTLLSNALPNISLFTSMDEITQLIASSLLT